jgi:hypothetical protein
MRRGSRRYYSRCQNSICEGSDFMVQTEMTGVAANGTDNHEIDYSYHYRHWHDDSDARFDDMAHYFADKLRPLLPTQQPLRIFEIGCGTGFALRGLQLLGYQDIEGVDADRCQVVSARRRNLPVTHVPASQTSFRLETCASSRSIPSTQSTGSCCRPISTIWRNGCRRIA